MLETVVGYRTTWRNSGGHLSMQAQRSESRKRGYHVPQCRHLLIRGVQAKTGLDPFEISRQRGASRAAQLHRQAIALKRRHVWESPGYDPLRDLRP